jgi:hypothetical protein
VTDVIMSLTLAACLLILWRKKGGTAAALGYVALLVGSSAWVLFVEHRVSVVMFALIPFALRWVRQEAESEAKERGKVYD